MCFSGLNMYKLEGIGCLRFCLSVVADCMVRGPENARMTRHARTMCQAAELVCRNWDMGGARYVWT